MLLYFNFLLLLVGVLGDNVVELTDKTFETLVHQRKNDEFYLVEFYNPHCGACRNFMPTYSQIADYLKGIMPVGRLATDKEDHKSLLTKYNVGGVPFVVLFKAGITEPVEYRIVPRTPENIIKWIISDLDRILKITSIRQFLPRPILSGEIPNQYIILYEGKIIPPEYSEILIPAWGKEVLFLDYSVVDNESMDYLKENNISRYPSILIWDPTSKMGEFYRVTSSVPEVEKIIQENQILSHHQYLESTNTNYKLYLLYSLLSIIGTIALFYLVYKPKFVINPLTEVKISKFN